MNTNKKSKIRNFICSILATFAFVLTSVSLLNFNKEMQNTQAAIDLNNTIEIENSNFTKDTDSIFPIKSISGFTAYSKGQESADKNPNCGVIDLSDDDYSTRFSLAKENREGIDNHVLMLTSESTDIDFGYRTKKAISMSANSNYLVTVDVYTEENAGIANLALYNGSKVFTEIKNINSNANWITYHIFVKTAEEALNLNLQLSLTSKGTALFDNIACYEINNSTLKEIIDQQDDLIEKAETANGYSNIKYAYQNEVDASHEVIKYTADKNSFFDGTKYVELKTTNYISGKNDENYTEISTVFDNDGTNKKAIKINNKQKTFVEYTTKDGLLNFKQGLVYKVSISAKTKNLSGSANLKLVQTNLEEGKTGKDSEVISISSSTSNGVNNNYQTYTFYVKASPKKDTQYNLVASLGSDENHASGELYISQILVTRVKTSNIATSSNSSKTIDLVNDYALSGNSLYINNGEFDAYSIEDLTNPFPATAANWTETKGNGTQSYGVINTEESNFNALPYKMFYPYNENTNENVLMMYNDNADVLTYTSESKSLSANSYNKINLNVQSQASAVTISIIAKKDGAEFEIASKSILTESKNWSNLTFYIKTGSQPIDVSVRATLNSTIKSCAFIDDVTFNYPSAYEAEYNACSNSDTCAKVDLTNIVSTNLLNGEENTNASFEIIDFETANYVSLVGGENVESFKKYAGENKDLIKLTNLNDTDYSVTSNIGYKLTSETKYKFSIDVYSIGLRTEVEDADLNNLGFGIKLTGFEDSFVAKQSNNVWTTYTFYIQPDSDVTAYLELTLGNEDLAASGVAYFGNIQFVESVEDDEFDNIVTNNSTMVLNKVEENKTEDNENNSNATDEEKPGIDKQTLLYLIPTIVFALAIVITIVGVFVRKIKWKKPSRKTKNAYDRNKTVSKQYYERKATMVREEKLRELNKQLEGLHNDRVKFEEEYKHNLSKLRELKIKRASKAEISKLEREMKTNQKTSSIIGMSITRTEREIEYMKTDLYYNSLVKKLASQGIEEETEEK